MKNTNTARKSNYKRRRDEENVKVVYISSPVKVKTSASRFRALVQQLTGRNSDVSRLTDAADHSNYNNTDQDQDQNQNQNQNQNQMFLDNRAAGLIMNSNTEQQHQQSPTSSDSANLLESSLMLMGHHNYHQNENDGHLLISSSPQAQYVEQSFLGMFPPSSSALSFEASQFDHMLGGYALVGSYPLTEIAWTVKDGNSFIRTIYDWYQLSHLGERNARILNKS